MPKPDWVAPIEALTSLLALGYEQTEAESLIFSACSREIVHASGIDRTLFLLVDPKATPQIRGGEFHERTDIPPMFWKKLLRAGRSEKTSCSINWNQSQFCFILDNTDAESEQKQGRYQECYSSVLVDRIAMDLVIRRLASAGKAACSDRPITPSAVSDKALRLWFAKISNPDQLPEAELWQAAKQAHPDHMISRERIRSLRGNVKKGRKSKT